MFNYHATSLVDISTDNIESTAPAPPTMSQILIDLSPELEYEKVGRRPLFNTLIVSI